MSSNEAITQSTGPSSTIATAIARAMDQGDFERARALLREFGATANDVLFHALSGQVELCANDGAKAEFHLRKAVELGDNSPLTLLNFAVSLYKCQRSEEGRFYLLLARASDPASPLILSVIRQVSDTIDASRIPVPKVTNLTNLGYRFSPPVPDPSVPRHFVDLQFNDACSHRCTYCVADAKPVSRSVNIVDQIGPDQYANCLLSLAHGVTARFSFAGAGECSEHKYFGPVVHKLLDAGHFVHTQTHGLNSKKILKILASYLPEYRRRISFGLSFHLAAYLEDSTDRRLRFFLDDHFARTCSMAREIQLIVVLSPKVLAHERTAEYLRSFAVKARSEGVAKFWFYPVEMYAKENGKSYPGAYSETERLAVSAIMREFSVSSGKQDASPEVYARIDGRLFLQGMNCMAMANTIAVRQDGRVMYCGQSGDEILAGERLILDRSFRPFSNDDPLGAPCAYRSCHCIAAGTMSCLDAHNIPLDVYCDEVDRQKSLM